LESSLDQAPHHANAASPSQLANCDPYGLPQILDLTQARGLRDRLIALLATSTVVLDASVVERMSTPCAQVLLAAGRAAEAADARFQIVNASHVFRAALADLGLQSEFGNWMV
jgi:chemotaxis protein CheX